MAIGMLYIRRLRDAAMTLSTARPGRADVEHAVIAQSGDLAYTVGFERGPASVAGGPSQELVIRVTHIYRRDVADWKRVHRHADFPPPDQRWPSQLTNDMPH
jgi:ketosteroid isomerase-like protein